MSFAVASPTLLVHSLSDLSPAVAGVITLPVRHVVQVEGELVLPANTRLVVPDTTVLLGRDPDIDGIVGDLDGPLIASAGNGLVVRDLFLRNPNAGGSSSCAYSTTNPLAPRVTRIQNMSVGGQRGVVLENAAFVQLDVLLDRAVGDGITFIGQCFGVQVNSHTKLIGVAGAAVLFEVGSVVQNARFNSTNYLLGAGMVGVKQAAGSTLVGVGFFANTFTLTGGVALDGISANGQVDVLFYGNYGISNSQTAGSIAIANNAGNITTVIPGAGTYVNIGSGNPGVHPLYVLAPTSARCTLSQPAGAPTGALVLAGAQPVSVTVFASLSVKSVLGTQKQVSMRVLQQPGAVPLTPAFSGITGSAATSPTGTLALVLPAQLDPGDSLEIQIANLTDGTDLIVDATNLGFTEASM